jgi:hypothetical protein
MVALPRTGLSELLQLDPGVLEGARNHRGGDEAADGLLDAAVGVAQQVGQRAQQDAAQAGGGFDGERGTAFLALFGEVQFEIDLAGLFQPVGRGDHLLRAPFQNRQGLLQRIAFPGRSGDQPDLGRAGF